MKPFTKSAKHQLKALHNFKLIKKLGSGCHGSVYLAEINGQPVCLKSEINSKRAEYEITAIKAVFSDVIQSPLLYKVYEIDNYHYFPMPYFPGKSLEKAIKDGLSLFEKIKIAECLKNELNELHARGYLHRDLKPSNIIYNPEHPQNPIKIIDLGRSVPIHNENRKLRNSNIRIKLFQQWTAPEYCTKTGVIGKHSDVYSFGYCLKRFFPEIKQETSALSHNGSTNRMQTYNQLEDKLYKKFEETKKEMIGRCNELLGKKIIKNSLI